MKTVDFQTFGLKSGDRVLDLGCGEGRHVISAYMEQDIEAVGVDLCQNDLQITKQRSEPYLGESRDGKTFVLSVADALRLPFTDHSFDKVICSEVLEHIPDYISVLKEIERVLKPGGVFCASVPRFWPEKICWAFSDQYHANEGGHIRIFKSKQLRTQIETQGFSYYHRHWAHALHSPFWWLKCLFWQGQDSNPLIKLYHKLLVWDLMDKPWITRKLEQLLNPLMGKSVVMYFRKGLV